MKAISVGPPGLTSVGRFLYHGATWRRADTQAEQTPSASRASAKRADFHLSDADGSITLPIGIGTVSFTPQLATRCICLMIPSFQLPSFQVQWKDQDVVPA